MGLSHSLDKVGKSIKGFELIELSGAGMRVRLETYRSVFIGAVLRPRDCCTDGRREHEEACREVQGEDEKCGECCKGERGAMQGEG